MKLFISPYQQPQESGSLLAGALLAFEFESGLKGYSDFLPRPDLSPEAPLKTQLEGFKKGFCGERLRLAAEIAWADAHARRRKKSLFFGLQIPKSHFFLESSFSDWDRLLCLGVSVIKIKLNPPAFSSRLKQIKEGHKAMPGARWRLDLNGSLKPADWPLFKRSLHFLWDQVEFIEDPFKKPALFCPKAALIKYAEDWIPFPPAPFRIVKPSRDRIFAPPPGLDAFMQNLAHLKSAEGRESIEGIEGVAGKHALGSPKRASAASKPLFSPSGPLRRLVFTHSFETPIGQAASAWLAGRFFRQYPKFWREGAFTSQALPHDGLKGLWGAKASWSPVFTPPPGFGLGYGPELRKAPWRLV